MRTVVLGAGESGLGAAILAQKLGHELWVSDKGTLSDLVRNELQKRGIPFEENGHSEERILNADQIVKSPGIPDGVPLLIACRAKGIPVISEIEFAGRHTQARIVGITGTNGKTTTTLLTHHLLQEAGFAPVLGGNVGHSFARLVAEQEFDLAVLELSSFQLDGIESFRPNWAVLLNITPDHLDRYAYAMENYVAAKFRITMNQREGDAFFYWQEDPIVRSFLPKRRGQARLFPLSAAQVAATVVHASGRSFTLEGTSLRGRHNGMNALFALSIALELGADADQLQAGLRSFRNAPHRMELIAEVDGVEYINDSKATNVDSAYYALEAMTKPVIWIAGGTDKGNDYQPLIPFVEDKVKALVCLGADNSKLFHAFGEKVKAIVEARSAGEAVAKASSLAREGDVVLLSPACASFDLFKNYEDRGNQFRKAVLELSKP